MACTIKLFQKFLRRRDFIGFFVDLDMRQHQARIEGESAQYLLCFTVVEIVETSPQNLPIERHDPAGSRRKADGVQRGGVRTKNLLDAGRVQSAQNTADRGMGR